MIMLHIALLLHWLAGVNPGGPFRCLPHHLYWWCVNPGGPMKP
jgi:hypothetical protein